MLNIDASYENIAAKIPENRDITFLTISDPSKKTVTVHWHDSIELLYVLSGTLTVNIEGTISEHNMGECIVINSEAIHSISYSADNQFILIELPFEWLKKYVPDLDRLLFYIDNHTSDPAHQECLQRIRENILEMQKLYAHIYEGGIFQFMQLLFEIMELLYIHCTVPISEMDYIAQEKKHHYLNFVIDYVNENYTRRITSGEIAEQLHLQPQYFCRYFKQHMGMTFSDYISELRLYKIYNDILETTVPIGDIISNHGFSNYSLFRKKFAEKFNCTPRDLRKS